jgi:hypothetical protein
MIIPGRSDRHVLSPGNVAALANTAGRVIVLGVAEDDQAGCRRARAPVVTNERCR